jgi:hypothetical protein
VGFTDSDVVVLDRSIWTGATPKQLTETPYNAVRLTLERRGPFFDRIRCEWADGTRALVRLPSTRRGLLGTAVEIPAHVPCGLFTHAVDWLRAGTQYEE